MKIVETEDGSHTLYSEKYGVHYHSVYGAIQESKHVFIDAALRLKAVAINELHILEIGFGTGLNALLTAIEAEKRNLKVFYTGIEKFPVEKAVYSQLNYLSYLQEYDVGDFFLNLHELPWNVSNPMNDHFSLLKVEGEIEAINYSHQFDIIYFDAFAPNSQPELWEKAVMERMYHALKKDGVLVTYCAKGVVKRTLKAVGFSIEAIPGPPGKREMTRATK